MEGGSLDWGRPRHRRGVAVKGAGIADPICSTQPLAAFSPQPSSLWQHGSFPILCTGDGDLIVFLDLFLEANYPSD